MLLKLRLSQDWIWIVAFSVSMLDFPNLASRSFSVLTALIKTSSILEMILGAKDIGAHNRISFKLKKIQKLLNYF